MSYWRTYYHLVWTTKRREPLIVPERIAMLQQSIRVVARDHGAFIHAIGGISDHVHVAVSIPPTVSVSDFVRFVKGSTSRFLNKEEESVRLGWFGWQAEFGVLTFGERSLPRIVSYIECQTAHHSENNLWTALEQIGELPSGTFPISDVPDVSDVSGVPGVPKVETWG